MKKRKLTKITSFILAFSMIISLCPNSFSYAEGTEDDTPKLTQEETTETDDNDLTGQITTEDPTEEPTEETTEQSEEQSDEQDTEEPTTEQVTTEEPTTEQIEQPTTEEQSEDDKSDKSDDKKEDKTDDKKEDTSDKKTEESSEDKTEETTEEQKVEFIPTFDKLYGDVSIEGIDFSSCELLISVSDPSVFTQDTEVVSEYKGIYLTRYPDAEQTKSAYTYYYDKCNFIDVNATVKAADKESESSENKSDDKKEEGSDDEDADSDSNEGSTSEATADVPEEIPNDGHGEADLSDLNNGDDAISNLNDETVSNYNGYIALIDSGADYSNVKKSVSVIGDDVTDENGHGTKMAETIAKANKDAKILSIKVLGADATGSVADVYAGIQYAISAKVSVINLSMSSVATIESDVIEQAVNEAINAGITVVVSAGNNGKNASYYTPANIDGAYTIGACDNFGIRKTTSNFGSSVDFYVTADTTSVATAKFSAYILKDNIEKVIEKSDVFERSKVEDNNDDSDVPKGILEGSPMFRGDASAYEGTIKRTGTYKDGEAYQYSYGDGTRAFCIRPKASGVNNKTVGVWEYTKDTDDYPITRAVLYCIYKGVKWGSETMSLDAGGNLGYREHLLLSRAMYLDGVKNGCDDGTGYDDQINICKSYVVSTNAIKEEYGRFVLMYCQSNYDVDDNVQDFITYRIGDTPDYSYLALHKVIKTEDDEEALAGMIFEVKKGNTTLGYMKTGSSGTNKGYAYTLYQDRDCTVVTTAPDGYQEGGVNYKSGTTGITFIERGTSYNTSTNKWVWPSDKVDVSYQNSVYPKSGTYATLKPAAGNPTHSLGNNPKKASLALKIVNAPNKKYYFAVKKVDVNEYMKKLAEKKGKDVKLSYTSYPIKNYASDTDIRWAILNCKGLAEAEYTIYYSSSANNFSGLKEILSSKVDEKKKFTEPDGIAVFEYTGNEVKGKTAASLSVASLGITLVAGETNAPGIFKNTEGNDFNINTLKSQGENYTEGKWTQINTLYDSEEAAKAAVYANCNYNEANIVYVKKVDTNGKPVPNLTFDFYVKVGASEIKVGSKTTNAEGIAKFDLTKTYKKYGGGSFVHDYTVFAKEASCTDPEIIVDKTWYYYLRRFSSEQALNAAIAGKKMNIVKTKISPAQLSTNTNAWAALNSSTNSMASVIWKTAYPNGNGTSYFVNTDGVVTNNDRVYVYAIKLVDAAYTEYVKNNPNYSLDNTEFTLYKGSNPIGRIVMNAQGKVKAVYDKNNNPVTKTAKDGSGSLVLDVSGTDGTDGMSRLADGSFDKTRFTVKETAHGKNFNVAKDTYVDVLPTNDLSKPATFTVSDTPNADPLTIALKKVSSNGSLIAGQSLEGAEFTVKFYAQDITKDFDKTWTADKTWTFATQYDDDSDSYMLLFTKKYKVSGSDDYFNNANCLELPVGHFTIEETKAPTGFNKDGKLALLDKNGNEIKQAAGDGILTLISDPSGNPGAKNTSGQFVAGASIVKEETSIRADLDITKVDETGKPLAGVEFKVTLVDSNDKEIQSVILVTDEKGFVSTASTHVKHSVDTNGGKATSGTWFGDLNNIDDNLGALPVGTYKIKELRCEANEGKQLEIFDDITVTNADDKKTYHLFDTNASEADGKVWNFKNPVISSNAKVIETDSKTLAQAGSDIDSTAQTVEDTVSYARLRRSTDYTLLTELMVVDKYNNVELYKDKDGKARRQIKTFTTASDYKKSIYELTDKQIINISGVDPAGYEEQQKKFVVYQTLYLGTFRTLEDLDKAIENKTYKTRYDEFDKDDNMDFFPIEHRDATDEDQTVRPSDIHTTIKDSVSQDRIAAPTVKATLIDSVLYSGLTKGEEYTVEGVLQVKEGSDWSKITYDPKNPNADKDGFVYSSENDGANKVYTLRDKNGNPVTAKTTFVAEDTSGYVDLEFKFDASILAGKSVVAFESLKNKGITITVHANPIDEDETIHYPEFKTSTRNSLVPFDKITDENKEASKEIGAENGQSFIDRVRVTNLIAGRTYRFKGTLMDKVTGKAIVDATGKTVTTTKEFTTDSISEVEITKTPDAFNFVAKDGTLLDMSSDHANYMYNGYVEVEFSDYDFSNLKNTTGVVFEEVYLVKDGKEYLIGEHKDINDIDQFLRIVEIHTNANDVETDSKIVPADTETTIEDEVTYKNLIPNKEYILTATLHVKNDKSGEYEDGDELLVNGKPVTVTHKFTPKTANGTEKVQIKFNTKALRNMKLVVFEKLSNSFGIDVAFHSDINDEKQTVRIPDGWTTATGKDTKDHIVPAAKEVTIIDKVNFEGLEPNKEYTMTGKLYSKETEKPLKINGKEVTKTVKFTPKSSNGFVNIAFTIDTTALKGQTIVVFEDCKYKGVSVFIHADIEDEEQSVRIPDGHTTATDKDTKDHIAKADKVTIVDRVYYENLIPDKEYSMTGTLYSKETGKPLEVDGKPFTKTVKFTPKTESGYVDIEFTFNTKNLKGKTIVVFEDCKYKGISVFTHTDINDQDQTVRIPDIGTKATVNGKKSIDAGGEVTIIDVCSYKNLIPGKKYTIKGVLMNKKTGKELLVNGKTVTAEKTFEAKTADGSVELTFKFDSTGLSGDVVVFERLYKNDIEIATHTDIEDEDQTITIIPPKTTPPKTGMTMFFILLGIIAVGGAGMLIFRKRNKVTR